MGRGLIGWLGPVWTIALAQLFGTSLWFSANGVAHELMAAWQLSPAALGWLTNAVQLGFIVGTLGISLSGIADRFPASRIFIVSAIAGGASNAAFAFLAAGLPVAILCRFLVGVSLAGIYPLGMKLIVSWAPHGTGAALAQLVAMLTLGTALPHLLQAGSGGLPWQAVVGASSVLAIFGALLIGWLGDGPHLPKGGRPGTRDVHAGAVLAAFRRPAFRASALGYFGHMWELYAFWTVVPLYLLQSGVAAAVPFGGASGLAFLVIAAGALGSLLGGVLSRRQGSVRVAATALALSGLCGLVFVFGWRSLPPAALLVLMVVWGAAVVADSPHFSAISAQACPPGLVGSALAIQNALGFAITVVSIAIVTSLFERWALDSAWLLLMGPMLGLLGFRPLMRDPGMLAASRQ
ncbi:MFS transporter [Imbroritus primus]|uniref:MFS transporter n=1 Tax=Imbroritus primus TaxID=3058603 RepID=A0ACD3SKH3_9BURK|nr:MFS transporter [Burkholderiaceae bacterium PBA]